MRSSQGTRLSTLAVAAAVLISGCGADQKVTVGEPGQQGSIARDLQKASGVAGADSARVKSGEKLLTESGG